MLPILPVLLILLFQGPANVERLALEGRLPAAIQAIQQIEGTGTDREALASLLAASKDPELAQALVTLLKWVEEPVERPVAKPIEPEPVVRTPIETARSLPWQEGFQSSQRSRDGPVLVV